LRYVLTIFSTCSSERCVLQLGNTHVRVK